MNSSLFKRRVPHGTGTMKWTLLGAVYSGQWREGQRHGQGVCVYRDGSYHKGEWREDRPLDPNLTMEVGGCYF
jgi:hypothetical protein